MSTNVHDQIHQLTEAFDEFVTELSIDELVGNAAAPPEPISPAWPEPELHDFASPAPQRRFVLTAAAVLLIAGLVGALAWINRRPEAPTASAPPATEAPAVTPAPSDVPGTISAEQADAMFPYGPLDFATTAEQLPLWPQVSMSAPPATTTGYGMNLCDSGYGTKVMRLDPSTGPAHAYRGTLCVFIQLDEPRPDAVTSCATATLRHNYARCQRLTDQTDTAGPGSAVSATANDTQQTAMRGFPSATAWDQPEVFSGSVSSTATFDNGTVHVTLRDAGSTGDPIPEAATVDQPGVCFTIDIGPDTQAEGCVGHGLLATGLAYGAFKNGDGPIELIGIVPDDITEVDIDGTVITPTNNIWHHTSIASTPPTITVSSPNGESVTG